MSENVVRTDVGVLQGNVDVSGTLAVADAATLVSATLSGSLNLAVQSLTAPAEAAADDTNRISTTANLIILGSGGNNNTTYLPDPADVNEGKVYIIVTTDISELRSEGNTISINGTAVTNGTGDATNELALAANTTHIVVRTSATSWSVTASNAGGTPDGV